MDKVNKSFAFAIILILFALLVTLPPLSVKADTNYTNLNGKLIMVSPKSNTTYKGNMSLSFTLNLSENAPVPWFVITEIGYTIDDNTPILLPIPPSDQSYINIESAFDTIPVNEIASVDISGLANGLHELKIFADGSCNVDDDGIFAWNVSLPSVNFSVYNSPPPNILIGSPQNKSYETANITLSSIPLNFTVDKSTSWIGYSLDNQINSTIDGNTTLTGLSEGKHSIIISANDTIGNMGASQPINFTIAVPTVMNSKTYLTSTVFVLSIAIIVTISVGVLVYIRHRKNQVKKV